MAMNENEIGYALRQQSSQLAELRRAMEGLTSSSGVLADYKRTLVNVTKNLDDLQNSLRTTTSPACGARHASLTTWVEVRKSPVIR